MNSLRKNQKTLIVILFAILSTCTLVYTLKSSKQKAITSPEIHASILSYDTPSEMRTSLDAVFPTGVSKATVKSAMDLQVGLSDKQEKFDTIGDDPQNLSKSQIYYKFKDAKKCGVSFSSALELAFYFNEKGKLINFTMINCGKSYNGGLSNGR